MAAVPPEEKATPRNINPMKWITIIVRPGIFIFDVGGLLVGKG